MYPDNGRNDLWKLTASRAASPIHFSGSVITTHEQWGEGNSQGHVVTESQESPTQKSPWDWSFFFSFVASTLKHQIATPPNTNLIIWLSRSDSAKVFVSGTLKILNSQWSSIRMWDLLHFNTVFKKTLWFSSHLGNFIQFTFLLNHWFYRDLLYGCSEPMLIPQNGLSWICSCQTHLNLPFPV